MEKDCKQFSCGQVKVGVEVLEEDEDDEEDEPPPAEDDDESSGVIVEGDTSGACRKSGGILKPHGMEGSMRRPLVVCVRQWTCSEDLAVNDLEQPGKRHLKGLSRVCRCCQPRGVEVKANDKR